MKTKKKGTMDRAGRPARDTGNGGKGVSRPKPPLSSDDVLAALYKLYYETDVNAALYYEMHRKHVEKFGQGDHYLHLLDRHLKGTGVTKEMVDGPMASRLSALIVHKLQDRVAKMNEEAGYECYHIIRQGGDVGFTNVDPKTRQVSRRPGSGGGDQEQRDLEDAPPEDETEKLRPEAKLERLIAEKENPPDVQFGKVRVRIFNHSVSDILYWMVLMQWTPATAIEVIRKMGVGEERMHDRTIKTTMAQGKQVLERNGELPSAADLSDEQVEKLFAYLD